MKFSTVNQLSLSLSLDKLTTIYVYIVQALLIIEKKRAEETETEKKRAERTAGNR